MESFEPTIVLIDDHESRSEQVQLDLEKQGYQVSAYQQIREVSPEWISSNVCCILVADSEDLSAWLESVNPTGKQQAISVLVITEALGQWHEAVSDYIVWPCGIKAIVARVKPYADLSQSRFIQAGIAASEEAYREIFNSSSNTIFIHEIETGRILSVNKTFESMYGYTCEEALELRPSVASSGEPPYTESQVLVWLEKAVKEGPQQFEWHARRKDGSLFWCEVSLRTAQIGNNMRVMAVVRDITQRKNAETSLVEYRDKLRSLASEMNITEERQRRYIASCLHDGACQELALAILKLQTFQASFGGEFALPVTEVVESLRDVVRDLRELTFDLSPPVLYMSGLVAAIEELLEDQFRSYTQVKVHFSAPQKKCQLVEELRCILYQCVRELIVNIIKHAQATEVWVTIEKNDQLISIEVRDNGVGFDVDSARASFTRDSGFGLFNIAERLDFVGGTFDMTSEIDQGSCFIMTVPCLDSHS